MDWLCSYIDIPFQEFGRTRSGCDCWGLVRLVYQEQLGINLPSYLGFYEDCRDEGHLAPLISEESKIWNSIPLGTEQMGDVIVLRMRGVPMHTAFIIEPGLMLHIHEGINAVIENYHRSHWKKRVMGIYRHQEIA